MGLQSAQRFSNGSFISQPLHVSVVLPSSGGSTQITENPSLTTDPMLLEYLSCLLAYSCIRCSPSSTFLLSLLRHSNFRWNWSKESLQSFCVIASWLQRMHGLNISGELVSFWHSTNALRLSTIPSLFYHVPCCLSHSFPVHFFVRHIAVQLWFPATLSFTSKHLKQILIRLWQPR
jgi:hypothetical protein